MRTGILFACLLACASGACTSMDGGKPDLAAASPSTEPRKGKVLQVGSASYYKSGRKTANGEKFVASGMTAAHPSLRFGTRVAVRNLSNDQTVIVRINDRGPFARGRIIDLALGAARRIGLVASGHAKVEIAAVE